MTRLRKGSNIEWNWGAHKACGKIVERLTSDVSRKIKGKTIKRKASKDEPAFLIRQTDGDVVIRSASEVHRASPRGTSD